MKRPTRIVMHTSEPASGAAQYVLGLVRGLRANGAAVTLYWPQGFEYLPEVAETGCSIAFSGHRIVTPASLCRRVLRNLRFFAHTAVRQLRLTEPRDIVHFQFPLYFPFGLILF